MTQAEKKQFERRAGWRDLLAAARGFCERMRVVGVIGDSTYDRKINALIVAVWALQHHEDIPRSALVEASSPTTPAAWRNISRSSSRSFLRPNETRAGTTAENCDARGATAPPGVWLDTVAVQWLAKEGRPEAEVFDVSRLPTAAAVDNRVVSFQRLENRG